MAKASEILGINPIQQEDEETQEETQADGLVGATPDERGATTRDTATAAALLGTEPEDLGLLDSLERDVLESGTKFRASLEEQGEITAGEFALQTAGRGIGLGFDLGTTLISETIGEIPGVKPAAKKIGGAALETRLIPFVPGSPTVRDGLAALGKGIEPVAEWLEEHPRAAANMGAGAEVISALSSGATGALSKTALAGAQARKAATKGAAVTLRATGGVLGKTPGLKGAGRLARAGKEKIRSSVELSRMGKEARNAIDNGVDERIVGFVDTATPEDASLFKRMTQASKEQSRTIRARVRGKSTRELVGEEIMKPVLFLKERLDNNGRAISETVKRMPSNRVDITESRRSFLGRMNERGLRVNKDGKVVPIGRRQKVPDTDIKTYQEIVDFLKPNQEGRVLRRPNEMHSFRQKLFAEEKLAKERQTPFSGPSKEDAEEVRTLLARELGNIDRRYRQFSKEFAMDRHTINEFIRLIGFKGDVEDLSGQALRAGEVSQRLLGSTPSRVRDTLKNLQQRAIDSGFDAQVDLYDQILFADMSDVIYGVTAPRSLAGQVERGIQSSGAGSFVAEALGETLVFGGTPIFAGIRGGSRMLQGITREQAMRDAQGALEKLIDAASKRANQ